MAKVTAKTLNEEIKAVDALTKRLVSCPMNDFRAVQIELFSAQARLQYLTVRARDERLAVRPGLVQTLIHRTGVTLLPKETK